MATAAVQQPQAPTHFDSVPRNTPQVGKSEASASVTPRDVYTTLNYFKDSEDGSPPHPTYIDKPETYARPFETHPVTVHDITGHEAEYTLDTSGFQVHNHFATEKDFLEDDQIKSSYYPETEQLLKDV